MMSKYPLPVYANEAETDETALESLPNIYPLSMYIDLVKQHVYREDNNTGTNNAWFGSISISLSRIHWNITDISVISTYNIVKR